MLTLANDTKQADNHRRNRNDEVERAIAKRSRQAKLNRKAWVVLAQQAFDAGEYDLALARFQQACLYRGF